MYKASSNKLYEFSSFGSLRLDVFSQRQVFCEEGNIEKNPLLAFVKNVILYVHGGMALSTLAHGHCWSCLLIFFLQSLPSPLVAGHLSCTASKSIASFISSLDWLTGWNPVFSAIKANFPSYLFIFFNQVRGSGAGVCKQGDPSGWLEDLGHCCPEQGSLTNSDAENALNSLPGSASRSHSRQVREPRNAGADCTGVSFAAFSFLFYFILFSFWQQIICSCRRPPRYPDNEAEPSAKAAPAAAAADSAAAAAEPAAGAEAGANTSMDVSRIDIRVGKIVKFVFCFVSKRKTRIYFLNPHFFFFVMIIKKKGLRSTQTPTRCMLSRLTWAMHILVTCFPAWSEF
jgi:hypothetical protein